MPQISSKAMEAVSEALNMCEVIDPSTALLVYKRKYPRGVIDLLYFQGLLDRLRAWKFVKLVGPGNFYARQDYDENKIK